MIEQNTEKAVFVGVVLEKGGERKTMEYLDELQFLAETAGAVGDKKFIQRLDQTYKATYDFDQDILYTDAFVDEVFDDLIDKLKIDKSKIIYKISYEPSNYQYQFPAYVHTIEDALNERRDIFYYIVTSEDLESYDFNEYMDLCTKIHYCNMVHIFSSDDFQNMETFQKEYSRIVIGEERGTVNYNGRDTDIIQVFNLKKYVLIGKKNHQMYFNRYSKDGLEYTSY